MFCPDCKTRMLTVVEEVIVFVDSMSGSAEEP